MVPDVLYVDEGKLLTSAGSAAGLDMCLHLVRSDFGTQIATRVAQRLGLSTHRAGNQVQYVARPVPARSLRNGDRRVAGSRTSQLTYRWTMTRLASDAGVSVRGLHRHFREATGLAPGKWLVVERIVRARELLEETTLSIEEISMEVGFGSASTLRAHFRRRLGLVPSAFRENVADQND